MLAQEVLPEHDLRHVHRVLRTLRPEERAHEGAIGVADVVVEHVEVARFGGNVHRLADDPPGVVQVGDGVMDLHELAEVVEPGVAPARVEVVHEGRTPGRAEHGVAAADGDGVRGVAGMLRELARGAGPDDPAAHAGLEAHPLAVHGGARIAEDREDPGVAAKLHPDVPEQAVGVALDEVEALLVEDVERGERAADAGCAGSGGGPAARLHAGRPPAPPAASFRGGLRRFDRHARHSRILKFRDSLTEMDSRFRGNDGQPVKATCLAEMTSFPRKRESIA